MAKRQPGADIPLPAMIHWKHGHFSALTKLQDGRYQIEDPTFNQGWVSTNALDIEASGYFLIPDGPLPPGWLPASVDEANSIFGRSTPTSSDPGAGGSGCGAGGGPPGGGYGEGGSNTTPCKGMPQYAFNMMRIGLLVSDVPIGYTPPRGPAVEFRVTYAERGINESGPFNHGNLGNQWSFEWLKYISDDTTLPSANVMVGASGNEKTVTGYYAPTQSYAVEPKSQAQLTRTSGSSYQYLYPDGSLEIYARPDNTNGPRRVYMTQKIDPAGNALTFTYDSSNRLVSVTDAIGQVTTNSYGLAADPLKITRVTDPFGRYATFQYNGSGQLTNITDEIGISSSFTYGAPNEADFINSMTTPYGTTTFTNGSDFYDHDFGSSLWIQATDPMGAQERAEFTFAAPGIPDTDPAYLVPAGMQSQLIFQYYVLLYEMNYRMSFFWDKKAMQTMTGTMDYTKARQYVWERTYADHYVLSSTVESIKYPLENRIWYNYPGQVSTGGAPWSYQEGTLTTPSAIGRVLDDGSSQIQRYQYNAIGKPIQSVDAAGRTTYFTYAANNIDRLTISQLAAGTTNLLGKFTYNSQHLPLTYIDAAGQTNYFGYNTNGQLVAATNALKQTLTLNYNTNGYLTNIVGALPGATTGLTYDGYGRVRTVTDSEGYSVAYDYDALDRPTKVTYPDGTYEQVTYKNLDPQFSRDRLGRWSGAVYNAQRQLTAIEDALGRITSFERCSCGALESITDPMGRTTGFVRDLQKRVTAKIYPDGTQINYAYENTTSRLKSTTDAKNQTTAYSYNIDNNLKQVSYSNAVIATPSVSFTYDTNYNRLLTMVDGTGTNSYGYYAVTNGQLGSGRLASVTSPLPNSIVTYNYDAIGRITNRAINGVSEQMTYDALGRMVQLTNVLGRFTNSYVNATMRVSTNAYPNGQKTIYGYYGTNNDERLQQIQNVTPGGANLSTFGYAYNAEGEITNWTQQADNNTPVVQVEEYDAMNQLLGATVRSNSVAGAVLKQFIYQYDKAGNRTGEQIGSGVSQSSYNNLNQLTTRTGGSGTLRFKGSLNETGTVLVAGSAAAMKAYTNFTGYATVSQGTNVIPVIASDYSGHSSTNKYQVVVTNNGVAKTVSYDLNGNETAVITATSTNTYQWDAANRLVSITGPTNQSLFTYDGLGRRVQIVEKTNNVAYATNNFLWCGPEICQQRDLTGGTVTKRFFDQGEQISSTNYFFTKDHLGSIREMTDGSGTIQARYDYDPYGRRTKVFGSMEADFAYAGYYYHSASGLYLTVLRAYDSELGRWASRDPIAERGGLNLYDYVLNDPINWLDPDGACGARGGGGTQATGGAGNGKKSFNVNDADINNELRTVLDKIIANPPKNIDEWINHMIGRTDTKFHHAPYHDAMITYTGKQYPELVGTTMTGHELNYIGVGAAFATFGYSRNEAWFLSEVWYRYAHGADIPINAENALMAGWDYVNCAGH